LSVLDPIQIVPYDPRWPERFAAEAGRVGRGLGSAAIRVDHVGSTAVAGLAAKPVIDIQVSVTSLTPLKPHVEALAALGYTRVAHLDDAAYPFFHRPSTWPHAFHLHLCEAGGPEERRHLAFCAYLRDHPQVAGTYAVEKRRLASRFSSSSLASRNDYAEAKSTIVEPLVRRALELGYPRT
jgi:GrpB-like predicted nucleotidyltransferase (UPF0157 family)